MNKFIQFIKGHFSIIPFRNSTFLKAIANKEMDFDFEMGKISEEDNQELKSEYKAKAVEILKRLDTVDGKDNINAAIEKEVQQLRG